MQYELKTKKFSMKEGINLPFKISEYKIDNRILFIAPEKASFIVSNDVGGKFIDLFKKQNSIGQVIEIMQGTGYSQENIVSELHSFLVEVEKRGFYEDAPVVEVNNPLALHLDITNKCNLRCVHCIRNSGDPLPDEMSAEEWIKTIETFSSQYKSRVCVTGGEALLHTGIFDILKCAKESGLHVTLFSNGLLINEQIVEKLENWVDKIQLSLDGATEKTNDAIRGKGSFQKVIKAFAVLEHTSIELGLAMSVMPQNVENLNENLEELMTRIGRRVNVRVSPVQKEGRASEEHLFSSDEIAKKEVQKLLFHAYSKGLRQIPAREKNIKLANCGYAETVVVSCVGDIYPCNVYEPRVKYGNVRVDDFTRIIKKMDEDRNTVRLENIEKCRGCDLKYFCFGGCRLNNIYRKNDISKASCTTEFKKHLCLYIVEKTRLLDSVYFQGVENDS